MTTCKPWTAATPVLAAALMLGACGGGGSDAKSPDAAQSVSPEQMVQRAKGVIRPEPGLYRSTMEVLAFDVPGAPAAMADRMKQAMGSGSTSEYCLTPQEAEQGWEEMARRSQDGDCTVRQFDVAGGSIDARMTCRAGPGGSMDIALTGEGTPTSADMTMEMTGDMGGMGPVNMRMRVTHRRIGDC